MDFLKAVYRHLQDLGLYEMDSVDWMAWIAFAVFILLLEVL